MKHDVKEKKALIQAALEIFHQGFVRGTWGNISALLPEGRLLITPSGVDYTRLRPRDISLVQRKTGNLLSGLPPSSELPLHLKIYDESPLTSALVHIHSPALSAISVLGMSVPVLTEDQAMIIGGEIQTTPYASPGSVQLAEQAAVLFKNASGCLLAHHGYIGGGRSLREALTNCFIAEKSAQIYLSLLPVQKEILPLPPDEVQSLRNTYFHYRPADRIGR